MKISQAWSLGVRFVLKIWPQLVEAGLLSPICHSTIRLSWSKLALYSQWEDMHLHGAFSLRCRETSKADPGGLTWTRHQVFGLLMLGKMPSHHKDKAIRRTPISSSEARTFPGVFQELLTAILPGKWGNANLVNTVSLISNDGIFYFA